MARSFDNLFIGGSWVPAGAAFDDLNPADGTVWARVADGNGGMAVRAIESAQAAFPQWSGLTYSERAHYMLKVADEFERRRDDLVAALQGEGGGWFGKGMFESGYVPEVFRAAAAMTYNAIGEVLPSDHGKVSLAMRPCDGYRNGDLALEFPNPADGARPRVPDRRGQLRGA